MKKSIWILFTAGLSVVMMLSACTKAGNIIYVPDPDEPMASTAPIVTVIYGQDGFSDGFYTDYYKVEYDDTYLVPWEKHLETIYLAEHSGEGYNIADTTALRIISEASGTIVPICGGAGYTMMYLCEITNINDYMGIDVEKFSWNCDMSILKHIGYTEDTCPFCYRTTLQLR